MAIRRNPPACNPREGMLQHIKKERTIEILNYLNRVSSLSKMWKGVYFTQSEYFSQFEIRKRCAFRPLRNCVGCTCLRKESLPPPSQSFITYQIAMENDETNIKEERISLLLARIHRKMKKYFCISAEIWLLPDDLRHLSVNSPNHQTQA